MKNEHKKYKVCLVIASLLPIPAIRGGAVETLMTHLIAENEKHGELELTIVSVADKELEEQRAGYKNTRFTTFSAETSFFAQIKYFFARCAIRIVRKLGKEEALATPPISKRALEALAPTFFDFDLIIYEHCWAVSSIVEKIIKKGKAVSKPLIYEHIHRVETSEMLKHKPELDGVISVSKFVDEHLPKNPRLEKNCYVLLNCIDVALFTKQFSINEQEALKNALGLTDEYVVCFVGRITYDKGAAELIKALALLDSNGEKVALLLIGSAKFGLKSQTSYEKKVSAIAQESKFKIIQTGFVPNDEIYKYQSIADVQVFSAPTDAVFSSQSAPLAVIEAEAAQLAVIEAEAAPLAVIAVRRGGVPEYVSHDACILLEPDEKFIENLAKAIKQLKDEPARAKRMAEAGQEFAKNFTTEKYYRDFVNIVYDIMEEGS